MKHLSTVGAVVVNVVSDAGCELYDSDGERDFAGGGSTAGAAQRRQNGVESETTGTGRVGVGVSGPSLSGSTMFAGDGRRVGQQVVNRSSLVTSGALAAFFPRALQ